MQVVLEAAEPVELTVAHAPAKGEFRCAECGYGVVVTRVLPRCPMCSEHAWERVDWRPFTERALS